MYSTTGHAASNPNVSETVVLRLAQTVNSETGEKNLCLAGGVALNCVANGRILHESPFKIIWIQPAAGDAGGVVGAAAVSWYANGNGEYIGPLCQEAQSVP